jgi:hypothetical protein
MQELILTTLSKWAQSLDFHFSRKGENYIFICEELGIHINAISQEEFFTAITTELLLKVEKFLKGTEFLGDLFGFKQKETPKPEKKPEQPKPSAKEQEKPFDVENWIKEELRKDFLHGRLAPRENSHEHFQKIIREQQTPVNPFQNWPNEFPWNKVICFSV